MVGHGERLLPLRLDLDHETTLSALLCQARDALRDAQQHPACGVQALREAPGLAPDPSRPPLVAAVLALDNGTGQAAQASAALSAEIARHPPPHTAFDLGLTLCARLIGAPVRAQDNVFDAGGHSLLAARLMSAVRRERGCSLHMPTLAFADPGTGGGGAGDPAGGGRCRARGTRGGGRLARGLCGQFKAWLRRGRDWDGPVRPGFCVSMGEVWGKHARTATHLRSPSRL